MAVSIKRKHAFHALYTHFGPYGPQDVHYHPCTTCRKTILVGEGVKCTGKRHGHHIETWHGPARGWVREEAPDVHVQRMDRYRKRLKEILETMNDPAG